MNSAKVQVTALPKDEGPAPLFVDECSVFSEDNGVVLRASLFGIVDCGAPMAPKVGAVPLARLVMTKAVARQFAKAILHHLDEGGEETGVKAVNENRPH